MPSLIRDARNFWAGAMFTGFGAAAILVGRDYELGSAGSMGPGYFPNIIGLLLVLIGGAVILRSTLAAGEPMERFAWRPLALVAGAVLAFGLLLRGAGLAPAVFVLVTGSSLAGGGFRLPRVALLAAGLALFATLVFIEGLGLPLQAIGPWLGG